MSELAEYRRRRSENGEGYASAAARPTPPSAAAKPDASLAHQHTGPVRKGSSALAIEVGSKRVAHDLGFRPALVEAGPPQGLVQVRRQQDHLAHHAAGGPGGAAALGAEGWLLRHPAESIRCVVRQPAS